MMHNRRFRILVVVICLVVLGFLVARGWHVLSGATMAQTRTGSAAPATRQKWEYCTILNITPGTAGWKAQVARGGIIETMDSDLSGTSTLNRLGAEGWELVSVSHLPGNSAEYFLKRPSFR
jgi:hypothetical protein